MNIQTNDSQRNVTILPLWARVVTVILCIVTGAIWYFVAFEYAVLAASSVLGVIGIATMDAWNRELRQDGYASLSQLYSGYLAAIFMFASITPALYLLMGTLFSIAVGIALSLFYGGILSAVAFKHVGEDHERVIETYEGPAVVYLPEGPYIKHTEEVAFEGRKERNSDV